jgi:hypothetical protein
MLFFTQTRNFRYARQQDPQLLRNILQHVNDVDGQGDFATYKALAAVVPEQRARMLTAAAEYYSKSKTGAALKVFGCVFVKECAEKKG